MLGEDTLDGGIACIGHRRRSMVHCRWNAESQVSCKCSKAVQVSRGQIAGTCRLNDGFYFLSLS